MDGNLSSYVVLETPFTVFWSVFFNHILFTTWTQLFLMFKLICFLLWSSNFDLEKKLYYETKEQLLATDILVLVTMKNAAKCDT